MWEYFGTFSGGGEVGRSERGSEVWRETEARVWSSDVDDLDDFDFFRLSSLSVFLRFATGRIASAFAMSVSISA